MQPVLSPAKNQSAEKPLEKKIRWIRLYRIGKQTQAGSTKGLLGSQFICLKSLRDMIMKVGGVQPKMLHDLVTVGFISSGLRERLLLMTCTKGYVCILQELGSLVFPHPCLEKPMKAFLRGLGVSIVNDEERLVLTMKNPNTKGPTDTAACFRYKNYGPSMKRKTSIASSSCYSS
ncbi:hypothetical protein BDA99DRAFT_13806 [Phascolomyces articulosus]|uniref:Uncharacterized protein n=1 Tax=Phascolomyces articulosus TaxID=60185 RepID=A0AAD5KCH5_9FUNG|nr:hypothetical protein BDA99DRAFT_13806 [Phascolomyces articulosus]